MAQTPLRRFKLTDLEVEIERRRKGVDKLHAERETLLTRLDEVDRQLADLTGEAPSGATTTATSKKKGKKKTKKKVAKEKRAKVGARRGQQRSLADMLVEVLSPTEPKQVRDLATEVKRRGYKTRSSASTFAAAVSAMLAKDPRFKKVERGQFVLAR